MAPARLKVAVYGLLLLVFGSAATARAGLLPARIVPNASFPPVVSEAPAIESVAPGIDYADYQLDTAAGPLAVRVVAIEAHRGDVRIGSIIANDSLVSHGETVGSMGRRSRAVAGINGDFFDIGNTYRPINMVVRDGALLQVPYKRYVFAVTRDGSAHIAEFTFSGDIVIGDRTMPLDGIDALPQAGNGISLLTPAYGRVPPRENVTLVELQPLDGVPPLARYRVTGVADNLSPQPPGYYVAIGPDEYGVAGVPDTGAVVTASGDLEPLGLDSITAAVGGGALVLHGSQWYDDPDAPYREENSRRTPCSGVGITSTVARRTSASALRAPNLPH
jgi:hypothetical protein